MLLKAKRGSTITLPLEPSEAPEVEADYRRSVVAYIPAKREKYIAKHKTSLLHSTLAAIRKAFHSKISGVLGDDLRLYLIPTVYDVYDGKPDALVELSIKDVNDFDESPASALAHFSISDAMRQHLEFLTVDPTTIAVHVKVDPVEIPAFGRYSFRVSNKSLFKTKTFHEVYDFTELQDLRAAIREGQRKRVVVKIPCYSASSAPQIANLRLPSTEVHLLVDVSGPEDSTAVVSSDKEMRCMLMGARIVCAAHSDAHSVLYSNRIQVDDNPAFEVRRARRIIEVVDKGIPSSAPSANSGVTDSINRVVEALLSKIASGSDSSKCSWSVSYHDQVVFSHNGLDRHHVGHIGEPLFGLAVLRAANGISPSVWSDMNLCTPAGLEKLLKKANRTKLHAALVKLYAPHGRLPSVQELLTHSAGLPQVGSVDAEVDIVKLEQLLPGSSETVVVETLRSDPEARLAHVLAERVHLVAAPGSVVHFSTLGYAVLAHCFPNLPATMKTLFGELGMDSTRMGDGQDSAAYPDDSVHHVSNCTVSTTNDLCRFIACIEKANQDPCAHPYLAHSLVPCYVVSDHGRRGLHSICNGGMESCVVHLSLKKCEDDDSRKEKVSLNAFFKFGERPGHGATLFVWIPGLHTGFSLHVDASIRSLFGKTHAHLGYGRKSDKKIFGAKHLIKMLAQSIVSTLVAKHGSCFKVDQEADYAYSITPKLPPRYCEYAARCANATDHPEGKLREFLENSPLIKDAVEFYPLFHAQAEIHRKLAGAPATMKISEEELFASMRPIRIFRKKIKVRGEHKEVYMMNDHHTGETVQLVYDKEVELKVGRKAALARGLHRGCMRKVSVHHNGDLGEHVTIHVVQLGPDRQIVGVHHRGCLYISKLSVVDIKNQIEAHRVELERTRLDQQRGEVNSKYFLWNVAEESIGAPISEVSKKQRPIEAGFGAGLALGGLAGLGVGAVAGASLARPYYYYPPPAYPYYPPPYYPYGYRRPIII